MPIGIMGMPFLFESELSQGATISRYFSKKIQWQIILFYNMVAVTSKKEEDELAKSHYQFKKRQKELARKKKKEQKRQQKMDRAPLVSEDSPEQSEHDKDSQSAKITG